MNDDGWILLLSCDFIGVKVEWIHSLIENIQENARIVLFRDVRLEPMLALYHSSIKDMVDLHLKRERRPMWALIEAVEHILLPAPSDWTELRNVNAPEDLLK